MGRYTLLALAMVACVTPAVSQEVGEVVEVDLVGGAATLMLDFSHTDYELILYSTVKDGPASWEFPYTVSGASGLTKLQPVHPTLSAAPSDRDQLDARLRQDERLLADRLLREGRWSPRLRKTAAPPQVGSERTFTFTARGGVTEDQTVLASLVAATDRALCYLDKSVPSGYEDAIGPPDYEAMLQSFSGAAYDAVTRIFGDPSDVDGDGKILFLFTHHVDEVGNVGGFFSARSLFPGELGGDGNQADMIYLSSTRPRAFYPALLAHEFQHLISFNQHVLVRKGRDEELWLNEGLSHLTEDLVDGHVSGGNRYNLQIYMDHPSHYGLTAGDRIYGGIRGSAYLFVRGLVDQYGEQILTRLVQTEQAGVPNVEAATGHSFEDLYRTFASRLFLSGTGLDTSPETNYTFRLLTEPTTGDRSLPPVRQATFSAGGAPVSGRVRPAAPAFVRLTGAGPDRLVEVRTGPEGRFQAFLIPVPRGFEHSATIPADYFPGITLDGPLVATQKAGEPLRIAGEAADPSLSRIRLVFSSRDSMAQKVSVTFRPIDGRFDQSLAFRPTQAGEYDLQFYAGHEGDSVLAFVGAFFPVTVEAAGSEEASIPVDLFPGVRLDEPLPTVFAVGQTIRISGKVTDPSVAYVELVFSPQDTAGQAAVFPFDVEDGRFGRSIVLVRSQGGEYDLLLYAGKKGSAEPTFSGSYSPVTVTATGPGRVFLPADYFPGIQLADPLPTSFRVGEVIRISGWATDPAVTGGATALRSADDPDEPVVFPFEVQAGRFAQTLLFVPSQAGEYELGFFLQGEGEEPELVGVFYPLSVTATGSERAFLPVDYFPGVTLDQPLPTSFGPRAGVRVSGRLSDPSVTAGGLYFVPLEESRPPQPFRFNVKGRRFDRTVLFLHSMAGEYVFVFFVEKPDAAEPVPLGYFSPIQVSAEALAPVAVGDPNADGESDVQDAVLVLRYASGLESLADVQRKAGDVNQDGQLNVQDAILILQLAAGLIDAYPKPSAGSQVLATVVATPCEVHQGMDGTTELTLEAPGSAVGAEITVSSTPEASLAFGPRTPGPPSTSLLVGNAQVPGQVRLVVADTKALGRVGPIVLKPETDAVGAAEPLTVEVTGRFYDAQGVPIGEVRMRRTVGPVLPPAYSLLGNRPNPFNPLTTIHYGLPEAG